MNLSPSAAQSPARALKPPISGKSKSTAAALLARGYWPVVTYPPGFERENGSVTTGKEPMGAAWGLNRITLEQINSRFKRHPGAGVGVGLGPSRAPGNGWLIDLEGDGEDAEDSLLKLLGGEIVSTIGWGSRRGAHRLFVADGDRLLELLSAAGAKEGAGIAAGVWKLDAFPGLEFRIGGFKEDGTVKQLQSVVPPTTGEDGKPRVWNGVETLAELPETAYATLEATAERVAVQSAEQPEGPHQGNGKAHNGFKATASARPSVEERARLYARRIDPAVSGQGGHKRAFYAACKLGPGFNLPEDLAIRVITEEFNPRCQPPWSAKEIEHKVRESFKVEPARGWLLEAEKPETGSNGRHAEIDYDVLSDEELGLIELTDVKERSVDWLWQYRLAKGEMALMAGEGGLGKSQLLLAIATATSKGAEWPDKSGVAPVGRTIILSAEDSPETTIKPRLMAMGADISKITLFKAKVTIKRPGKPPQIHPVSLQDRITWQKIFDRRPDTSLFLVDPLPSYLGRGVNDHRNSEIREVIEPFLDEITRPRGICLFANTHLNKAVDMKTPAHRIMGSVAYSNLARNVNIVVRDSEDTDKRFLMQIKCNNAPEDLPAIPYKVERRTVASEAGEIETAIPVFDKEPMKIDLQEVMNGAKGKPRKENAEAFLIERFRERSEWASKDINDEAKKARISRNALWEAKEGMDVCAIKRGNAWFWWVPPNWSYFAGTEDGTPSESVDRPPF